VGAWRNGASWNHAKLIAVDGKYLHTGGHNLWHAHYLEHSPVHDLSLELAGKIAHCGHLYANAHWEYIERKQSKFIGRIVDALPDALPTVLKMRMTITEFPHGDASEFPPSYRRSLVPKYDNLGDSIRHLDDSIREDGAINMIAIGRKGQIGDCDKSSDSAFIAMIESAKKIIRMGLQDLGPVCIPGTKVALPGCTWPHQYLSAIGKVIWTKGVDVEIVLSNPGSIPGGLSGTEANYGNGWSCVDVAAEIIKEIRKQFPDADDADLRQKVAENLRICFLRSAAGNAWADGNTKGMHAKHFIVDDVTCYVGSQNLYVCDLAEWGVVIDNAEQVRKIKRDYWDVMWKYSYTGEDVDVQEVMDGLEIDRDGADPSTLTPKQRAEAAKKTSHLPSHEYCSDHESDCDD
jgi:phosphatidylserine/phosphatidylglycerophosphate/cardiolipin synthase-like enzyme